MFVAFSGISVRASPFFSPLIFFSIFHFLVLFILQFLVPCLCNILFSPLFSLLRIIILSPPPTIPIHFQPLLVLLPSLPPPLLPINLPCYNGVTPSTIAPPLWVNGCVISVIYDMVAFPVTSRGQWTVLIPEVTLVVEWGGGRGRELGVC